MKRIYPIVLLISTLLASCSSDSEKPNIDIPTVAVKTKKVVASSENYTIKTSGKVAAKQSATISTRAMGNVKNVTVNVGDYVTKGQVLLSLDDNDLKAKLAQTESGIQQAKANLTNVEINYNRLKNLFAMKSASKKELDDITALYNIAKAKLNAAKQNKAQVISQLKYTQIKAPFNGLITQKMIKSGDLANPGMPLLTIEDNRSLEVETSISESDIAKLDKTSPVKIFIPSLNKNIEGEIRELSSSAKNSNGQFIATVSFTEKTNILPGMYAKVLFKNNFKNSTDKLLIDKNALVTKGQLTGVYTVSQRDSAILHWIEVGEETKEQIQVISGLSKGDTYIVSSEAKLFNGVKITRK